MSSKRTVSPETCARGWAGVLPFVLMVVGCGGAPDAALSTPPTAVNSISSSASATPSVPSTSAPSNGASESTRPSGGVAGAPNANPSLPSGLELRVARTRGVFGDVNTLVPVRGAGYEPVQAAIWKRNHPWRLSPIYGVRPVCLTSTRCEYLPPRHLGVPSSLVVSLNEGSIARLAAVNDVVSIEVRELDLPESTTVTVSLTVDGSELATHKIVYASSRSSTAVALGSPP